MIPSKHSADLILQKPLAQMYKTPGVSLPTLIIVQLTKIIAFKGNLELLVILIALTALPLLFVILLIIMLVPGLPINLLAIKMSALVPSLLVLLQLQVDAKSMVQIALPPMPAAILMSVVLVLPTLLTQTDFLFLSALPSSLSFSLSDEVKRYVVVLFAFHFVHVCSVDKIRILLIIKNYR